MSSLRVLLALASTTSATILWDGRLNNYTDASFLESWSWSKQVGPYQYYIHGSENVSDYITLCPNAKNPADTSSEQGIIISIDETSSWNGQNMMRTELIPSTKAPINKGKVFYHFSITHSETNPPTKNEEHQLCFFESHFTELKYRENNGSGNLLRWLVDGQTQWNATLEPGVWHNVAYGIDFDAKTVAFYHSTGEGALELIKSPVAANTFSDGADWHLGVLRLPGADGPSLARESWQFSGVYIEDGELTKTLGAAV
ncbi:hypothetical protein CKM354_001179000 [Cercospora kikuchii]|uniref:Glycoside hydrolase 131 catalytic N-terminal domain-containing protein n=1 Tax=Cercospora kikuchii TaxID=84275 RepID=A0A9P3CXL2_9PEZI|nr:uncharacterized protein CKM354_001179000 [Cercospora kikuchii]GIZ48740.1 hypothetical protein CKM354_001179000 [Cercospora kikuchii]